MHNKEREKIISILSSFLRVFKKLPEQILSDELTFNSEYGVAYYKSEFDFEILESIKKVFPDVSSFNDTFWASFSDVSEKSQEELWSHAILHYLTTYGFDELEVKSEYVYLPEGIRKKAPKLEKILFIDKIDYDEAAYYIFDMLSKNIGIKRQTLEDFYAILESAGYSSNNLNIESFKNKEARAFFYHQFKGIPKTADETIKLLNYIITNDTLFVKNQETLFKWKIVRFSDSDQSYILDILKKNESVLAQSWFRYKDFLLQLKRTVNGSSKQINKISRLSKKLWQPKQKTEFLTTKILNAEKFEYDKFFNELEKLDTFQLVKVYNRLVQSPVGTRFYHIRNGKFFIKNVGAFSYIPAYCKVCCNHIKDIIKSRINKNLIIKFNPLIDLAFPTSEKSFIGDIPFNSVAKLDNLHPSVIGISWKNKERPNVRVDLDLSIVTEDGNKYGWNSYYKSPKKEYIYSGDMTTEGSESFYIKSHSKSLLYVNSFNVEDCDYDFFISDEKEDIWKKNKNYIINPNNLIYSAKLHVKNESVVGIYDGNNSFIFTDFQGGHHNISFANTRIYSNLDSLIDQAQNSLKLKDIFTDYNSVINDYSEFYKGYLDFDEYLQTRLSETGQKEVIDLSVPNKSDIFNLLKEI